MGVKRGAIKKFAELNMSLGCLIPGVPEIKGKPGCRQIEKLRAAIVSARESGRLDDVAKRIVIQMELLSGGKLSGPVPPDMTITKAVKLAAKW